MTATNPPLNERPNREAATSPFSAPFALGIQVEPALQSLANRDATNGLPKTREALETQLWDRVEQDVIG